MSIDIFSSGNTSIERLIQSILQFEAQPRFALEDRKRDINLKSAVLTDLDSKLSTLHSLSKRLTDQITDHFSSKAASSSDKNIFTASVTTTALAGNHDVFIERLASSDTRVSKQYDESGTDLRTFFDANGSQVFQIDVGHPTSTDSTNRETISVTINPTGSTNDDILDEIATAINDAMSAAVTAGTITNDEKIAASVVHEESGKSRLIFRSEKSGFTYRMGMTDSANSLLATLEINSSVQSSGTSGGFITNVGTSATDSALNAKLQIDGLTFFRDSNTINDILDGVTLNLKDVTTATETLTVSVDSDSVKKEVEDFLGAFNDVLTFIRAKTAVDPTTNSRGALAGESTYRGLISNLRGIMSGFVDSVTSGNPEALFEIGITAASDGTLSITDEEKFQNVLAEGSTKIADLFNSTNGIASRIKTTLEQYVKVGGIIDNSKDVLDDRIKSLDNQINRFDDRLFRREQQLREQFAQMQKLSQLLGRQSAAFLSISSGF